MYNERNNPIQQKGATTPTGCVPFEVFYWPLIRRLGKNGLAGGIGSAALYFTYVQEHPLGFLGKAFA